MIDVDKSHNGRELELPIGETLDLRLPENPTTGYRWQARAAGQPALELSQDSVERHGPAIGDGGVRRWTFRAVQAGVARLDMELRRSWEQRAVDTFSVVIRVAAP
jgi:inhibitor of cysteine peptidase